MPAVTTSASEVAGMARAMLASNDKTPTGVWPRAAAFLARQALETAVRGLWEAKGVDLQGAQARAQFLCIATYLGDPPLAGRCRHAWAALSRACHHHPYELAPTAGEIERWLDVVDDLIRRLQEAG